MSNDESSPKSECRRQRATGALFGFRASGFFRISSFGFRHSPAPPHVGCHRIMNDLKFAFRQLLKNPGFTAVAVLTLALGIGANTAILTVVNAVLLRSLPYAESDRLVWLSERSPNFPTMSVSYPNFTDWRVQQTVFEQIGVYNWGSYNLTGRGEAQRLTGVRASADVFSALRARPALGRLFNSDEDKPGAPAVVLLSHGLWQDRFGGAADILNQAITLDGRVFTVIGVMPAGFAFPNQTDLWVPVGPL